MTENNFNGEEYKDSKNLPEVGKITESEGIHSESKANINKPEVKKGWFSKLFGVKSQSPEENLGSSNQNGDLDRKEDDDILLGISKDGLSNEIKSPINIDEIYNEKLQDSNLQENSDSSIENITQEERREGMILPEMEISSQIIEGAGITNTFISSSDINLEMVDDTFDNESERITLDFEEIIDDSIVYEDIEIESNDISEIVLEREDYTNLYEVEEFYEIDIDKLDHKKIDKFVLNPLDEDIQISDIKPDLLDEAQVDNKAQIVEVKFKDNSLNDQIKTNDEASAITDTETQLVESIKINNKIRPNKDQNTKRSKKIKISKEDESVLQRFTRRENNKESLTLLGSGLSFLILQLLFSLQFSIGGLRNLSFAVVATNSLLATVAISLLLLLVTPKYYLKGSKLFFEYTTIKFFNLLSLIFLTIVYFLALPFAKISNRRKYLLAHPEHLYWVENLNGFTGWSTWRNKIIVGNKKTFLLTLIGVFAYRKNYFLFAIFTILLIISMFILFAQSSAIAPFIYTII